MLEAVSTRFEKGGHLDSFDPIETTNDSEIQLTKCIWPTTGLEAHTVYRRCDVNVSI